MAFAAPSLLHDLSDETVGDIGGSTQPCYGLGGGLAVRLYVPLKAREYRSLIRQLRGKKWLVVDIEPTGRDKSVTKIGKNVDPTREEAKADVKRVCKEWSRGSLSKNAG